MSVNDFSAIRQRYADAEVFQLMPEIHIQEILQHTADSRKGLKRLKLVVFLLIGFVVLWNLFVAGRWISGDAMDILKAALAALLLFCISAGFLGFLKHLRGLKLAKNLFNEQVAPLPLEKKGKLFDEMSDIVRSEYGLTFQGLSYKERVRLMEIKRGLNGEENK